MKIKGISVGRDFLSEEAVSPVKNLQNLQWIRQPTLFQPPHDGLGEICFRDSQLA